MYWSTQYLGSRLSYCTLYILLLWAWPEIKTLLLLLLLLLYIWGVSRKLATFEERKMNVTGMNLRDLNVLLLHYPFMSNPRYCLGCATKKKGSTFPHFFTIAIFVSRTQPLFANFASTSRKGPTFPLKYKKCISHVPRRK